MPPSVGRAGHVFRRREVDDATLARLVSGFATACDDPATLLGGLAAETLGVNAVIYPMVLGGLWQRLVPVGSIAYRANLLSAAAGAGIAALVYGAACALARPSLGGPLGYAPGLVAGAAAPND